MESNLKVYRIGRDGYTLVGDLNRLAGSFTYAESYLRESNAQPISGSLPLRWEPYEQNDAISFFEGLVPEGEARRLMAGELKVRVDDYLSMLAYCGLDCVGDLAITEGLLPLPPDYDPIGSTELRTLFARHASMAELNGSNRLSLAGTQSKVGLAHMPDTSLEDGWMRAVNSAGSTHILKVSSRDDISYFEYLCMRAAEICGLRVAKTSLLDFGVPVICSERFDRLAEVDEGKLQVIRLHQEDFTQVFGWTSGSKYAELDGGSLRTIADYLRAHADNPVADIREFAKTMLFNYLIGNCDNHLKNVSLLYGEDWIEVSLAPTYDLACTTWYPNLSRDMGMAINGVSDIDEVTVEDVRAAAGELGISQRELSRIAHDLVDRIDDAIADAVQPVSDMFDEIDWKADELREDMATRKTILSAV